MSRVLSLQALPAQQARNEHSALLVFSTISIECQGRGTAYAGR